MLCIALLERVTLLLLILWVGGSRVETRVLSCRAKSVACSGETRRAWDLHRVTVSLICSSSLCSVELWRARVRDAGGGRDEAGECATGRGIRQCGQAGLSEA